MTIGEFFRWKRANPVCNHDWYELKRYSLLEIFKQLPEFYDAIEKINKYKETKRQLIARSHTYPNDGRPPLYLQWQYNELHPHIYVHYNDIQVGDLKIQIEAGKTVVDKVCLECHKCWKGIEIYRKELEIQISKKRQEILDERERKQLALKMWENCNG